MLSPPPHHHVTITSHLSTRRRRFSTYVLTRTAAQLVYPPILSTRSKRRPPRLHSPQHALVREPLEHIPEHEVAAPPRDHADRDGDHLLDERDVAPVRDLADRDRHVDAPVDRAQVRAADARALGRDREVRRLARGRPGLDEVLLAVAGQAPRPDVPDHDALAAALGRLVQDLGLEPVDGGALRRERVRVPLRRVVRLVVGAPAGAARRVDGREPPVVPLRPLGDERLRYLLPLRHRVQHPRCVAQRVVLGHRIVGPCYDGRQVHLLDGEAEDVRRAVDEPLQDGFGCWVRKG